MIRRFGFDEIMKFTGGQEDAAKMLVNIKKRKDRAKRKRAAGKDEDEDGDSDGEVCFCLLLPILLVSF